MPLTLGETQRGKPKLTDEDNYEYRRDGQNKKGDKLYWMCLEHKKEDCKARITTDAEYNLTGKKGSHDHPSIKAKTDSNEIKAKIREAAKVPSRGSD